MWPQGPSYFVPSSSFVNLNFSTVNMKRTITISRKPSGVEVCLVFLGNLGPQQILHQATLPSYGPFLGYGHSAPIGPAYDVLPPCHHPPPAPRHGLFTLSHGLLSQSAEAGGLIFRCSEVIGVVKETVCF